MTEADAAVRQLLLDGDRVVKALGDGVLALEQGHGSVALGQLLRSAQLLSGASASLGFPRLAGLTSAAEQLVEGLHEGEVPPTVHVTGALRQLGTEIAEALGGMCSADAGSADRSTVSDEAGRAAPCASGPMGSLDGAKPAQELAVVIPTPPGVPAGVEAPPIGRLLVERRVTRPQDVTLAVMQQGEGDERPIGEILVDHGAATAAHVVDALEHQAEVKRAAVAASVRVDVGTLEALAQLVAELAETRDQILAHVDGPDDAMVARLDRVSRELQGAIRGALPNRPAAGDHDGDVSAALS